MAEKEINQEIEKALEDVYEKHLPKSQAQWLKQRLEKVEELEEQLEAKALELQETLEAKGELEKMLEKCRSREKEVAIQEKVNIERSHDLDEREEKVSKRENIAEVKELEIKLEASEKIANSHHEFLATLTKAPVVRRTLHESVNKDFQNKQTETGYADKESGHHKVTDIDDQIVE